MGNVLKRIFEFTSFYFAIFSLSDMVDFILNIRSELVWDFNEFRNKFMLGGLSHPKTPVSWGFGPPSALRPDPEARMILDWISLANWLSGIIV